MCMYVEIDKYDGNKNNEEIKRTNLFFQRLFSWEYKTIKEMNLISIFLWQCIDALNRRVRIESNRERHWI